MQRGLHGIAEVVVPPVELHEIELLGAQAAQRAVNRALEVGTRESRQQIEIGDALGVHTDCRRARAMPLAPLHQELADHRLDTGVDVAQSKAVMPASA